MGVFEVDGDGDGTEIGGCLLAFLLVLLFLTYLSQSHFENNLVRMRSICVGVNWIHF